MDNTTRKLADSPEYIRGIEAAFQDWLTRHERDVIITGRYAHMREAQIGVLRAAFYAGRGIDVL